MCDFPITLKKKRRFSDGDFATEVVPCGKCKKCKQRRANQWNLRIHYEQKISLSSYFVTLTYDVPPRTFNDLVTVDKKHIQDYIKRLRKSEPHNKNIKYYMASEYGDETQRPHYHIIFFNVQDKNNIARAWQQYQSDEYKGGLVTITPVIPERVNYVTTYIGKKIGIPTTDYDDRTPEFSLMSKKMGLYYVQKATKFHKDLEQGFTILDGIKYNLPRYYRNKIWPSYKMKTPDGRPFGKKQLHNPELKKIAKKNYENFIKNQTALARNFDSISDFEKNERDTALANNAANSSITYSKI